MKKKFGFFDTELLVGTLNNTLIYYPKACLESMKTKTYRRADCKFFHITGTKKEEKTEVNFGIKIGNFASSTHIPPTASLYNSGFSGNQTTLGDSYRANVCPDGKNDEPSTIIPNSDPTSTTTSEVPKSSITAKLVNENRISIGCWNIRRGLIKRETEIKNLITEQDLDVLILVETDTNMVTTEKDYMIPGFKTWLPIKKETSDKTRLLMLTKLDKPKIKIREDLMSADFPSIWIEEDLENVKNLIIGGFYREWSIDGTVSCTNQTKSIRIFGNQIEAATRENKSIILHRTESHLFHC